MRVIVIGAGVIGLSCAIRLAESGHDVAVLARDLPLETTSAVAAAIWYPYLAAPRDRVDAWCRATYHELVALAETEPSVTLRFGTEYLERPTPSPPWADVVPDLTRAEAIPGGFADGWSFTSPVVEMPQYLRYLIKRLQAAGGTLTRSALPALPNAAPLVVNCTGLGARRMAGDTSLNPVRGQVLYVEQPGITEWLIADRGTTPTYVIPREHDVVVGGTSEAGVWNLQPDPDVAQAILARATALVPKLRGARVLGHRVGLRPARPTVRCEAEQHGDRLMIHCYGHGGAGPTTSWGCATDVATMVETAQRGASPIR